MRTTQQRHGHSRGYGKATYQAWINMRQRCSNPNHAAYADYGGRGIVVCERWGSFTAFLADMGERPDGLTLERIDNDKGYGPSNCRWASMSEQIQNRRCSKLKPADAVEIATSSETHQDLAARFGVSECMISMIKRGRSWSNVTGIEPTKPKPRRPKVYPNDHIDLSDLVQLDPYDLV